MVRAHIHFYGTVQGVGFRYTTLSYAQQLSLTGWVRNLSDGSVEVMVEGPRAAIDGLISKLKEHFGNHIHQQQVEWLSYKEEFENFAIEI